MIERNPQGTDAIPYPHKVFNWKRGNPTMTVELPPTRAMRLDPPKFEGWEAFFIGFHGYEKPMHMSYRPV